MYWLFLIVIKSIYHYFRKERENTYEKITKNDRSM